MDMIVAVFAAVAMVMAVRMRANRRNAVAVGVIVVMPVVVGMHRAVLMDVGVFVRICVRSFDLRFPCAAAANCTHIRLLITQSLFP